MPIRAWNHELAALAALDCGTTIHQHSCRVKDVLRLHFDLMPGDSLEIDLVAHGFLRITLEFFSGILKKCCGLQIKKGIGPRTLLVNSPHLNGPVSRAAVLGCVPLILD